MDIRTAKRRATSAGLELYYDRQWRTWGLIDPECRAEQSEWMSAGEISEMSEVQFARRISAMHERIYPDASGDFPTGVAA